MFWFEDFYSNKDITPLPTPEMSINGKPGHSSRSTRLTVEARFAEPYPMFVDVLSAFTQLGAATPSAAPSRAASWGRTRRPTT